MAPCRELESKKEELMNFFLWFSDKGEQYIDVSIEKMIYIYLKEND
jgi:hypothetical protein